MPVRDAVAIIAGTSIGGGFLALPSVTAPMGFLPTAAGLAIAWAFLVLTSVVYVEASARTLAGQEGGGQREADEVSVVTVTRSALGGGFSLLCSAAFSMQMLVVVTAQVVKSGEILSFLTGLPYVVGCFLPSLLVGAFSFCAQLRVVEQANTALAVAMVGGFLVLVAGTLASASASASPAEIAGRMAFASWSRLLPSTQGAWALPIFLNLICFGQSVPLVVGRLGAGRPEDARKAVVIGATLPLLMCVLWTAVSTALLDPAAGAADPVLQMLAGHFSVAVPVGLIAIGAIGTTLIASYLCLGQFASDALCATMGRCTLEHRRAASVAAVLLPALLACAGPRLYLPLLAFAGAFPTTLLYGLMPPLALLALRRLARKGGQRAFVELLPGGGLSLGLLVASAASMLLVSTTLSLRAMF